MSIHRESSSTQAMAAAIDRAVAGRDIERAALLLLIEAVRTLEQGTIDDLIATLAGEEAGDEHA